MDVRVVTLKYADGIQGFPESALLAAAGGREVLSAREHFFVHGHVPHLTLVLELGGEGGVEAKRGYKDFKQGEDPELGIPEERRKLYRDLKAWRNATIKSTGRNTFAVGRNTLMAEIARRAPQSLAELKETEGVGEAWCAEYGRAVVELCAGAAGVGGGAAAAAGGAREEEAKA